MKIGIKIGLLFVDKITGLLRLFIRQDNRIIEIVFRRDSMIGKR